MIEIKCESVEELRQLLSLIRPLPALEAVKEEAPVAKTEVKEEEPPQDSQDPVQTTPEPVQPVQPAEPDEQRHTLADVRAILADVQKKKGKEVLKSLLDGFGAKAVSKVPEDKLEELYAKAVELNA